MLAAVQQYGEALCWASEVLCADREVVLAAVQLHGEALFYASDRLQHDKEILSWADLTRAQCLWRKYREHFYTERIVEYWGQQTMKAVFDADGTATMQGRGAKRAREEYEADI